MPDAANDSVFEGRDIETVDGMNCDLDDGQFEEAERLYHVAFEQLRRTTREDEESFVERMRRWEESEHGDLGHVEPSPPVPLPTSSDGRIPQTSRDEEEGDSQEADDEEDDDELELKVDVELDFDFEPKEKKATEIELDEITRRFKGGACELEDYSLVRHIQAQTRGPVV